MILLLLACQIPVEDSAVDGPEPLAPPRLLRRLSLDLRGTFPTVEELDAVEADPSQLEVYRQQWLSEPALEEQLVLRLAERWHTRVDRFDVEPEDYGLLDDYGFHRSVGEEPLRLVARVAVSDRSWDEVVTADHSVADERLASIWPLEREQGEGWTTARYTDGRPHAGVLTTNGLWWRYNTDVSNMNRRRVAAIERLLVCHELLDRPVSFEGRDVSASVEDAVHDDPACVACHSSVDPAAAALFGFWWVVDYSEVEASHYHPERERLGEEHLQVEPAWHGHPVSGPQDLAQAIAADPRFPACAVQTFAELTWRRPVDPLQDSAELARLLQVFEDGDRRVLPLLDALTAGATYRSAERHQPLPPDLIASAWEDLSGFRWTQLNVDLMDEDPRGLRVLAGGVDGERATSPQTEPGLTRTLVLEQLAERASLHAQEQGQELDMEQLYWRTTGERPTLSDLDPYRLVLDSLSAGEQADEAQAATRAAMLRDPLAVTW